jgi:two-component system OmpR family sensor kinase
MNRLFLRFFVLVMLSVSAATIAIYGVTTLLFGDPLERIAREQAAAQIFLLEQYIDKAPADEWLARLNKVREVSDFRLDLLPLDSVERPLSDAQRAALYRGEIVLDITDKAFLRRVDLHGERYVGSDGDVLRVSKLPIDIGQAVKIEVLRYVIVALALLVPIAFWSRNHWRGVQTLSNAADDFGRGELATRIALEPGSGLEPLAHCMNRMAERIEHLLEAHRSLLHSVSHELRTPIARLEFGLELLREEAQDQGVPQQQQQQRINALQTDVTELNALVKELLDLSKLEQQQTLPRERFALAGALRASAHSVVPSLAARQFDLELDDDLGDVEGDRRLMMRAFGNLLDNAAKYGRQRVLLSARRSGVGRIEVTVEDDGPGIPAAERQKVFEPFYRSDGDRSRASGFGLGLAIARRALLLHGAEISVSESALGGARFCALLKSPARELTY